MKYCNVPSSIRNSTKNDLIIALMDAIQRIEVTEKALKLACDELFRINNFCIGTDFYKTCVASRRDCKDCWKEYYLQKAREQNDDN